MWGFLQEREKEEEEKEPTKKMRYWKYLPCWVYRWKDDKNKPIFFSKKALQRSIFETRGGFALNAFVWGRVWQMSVLQSAVRSVKYDCISRTLFQQPPGKYSATTRHLKSTPHVFTDSSGYTQPK